MLNTGSLVGSKTRPKTSCESPTQHLTYSGSIPKLNIFAAGFGVNQCRGPGETRKSESLRLPNDVHVVNINLDRGWFITSKPTITANWKARGGERWLVPVGGGLGKVFRIGRFGISLESQAFGYPVRPDAGPTWSVGLECKVLFRRGQIRERVRERRHGAHSPGSS